MLPSEAQCSWLMVEAWLSKALCSVAGCKKAGNAPSLDFCLPEAYQKMGTIVILDKGLTEGSCRLHEFQRRPMAMLGMN